MNTFMKILKIIFLGFVLLVIIINAYSLVNHAVTGDNLTKFGNNYYHTIDSSDMEPHLYKGDIVVLNKKEFYYLEDIITYSYKDIYITGRIVDIENSGIITKGDDSINNNPTTTIHSIKGKVVSVIPRIGSAIAFFKNPAFTLIMMVAGFFVLLYDTSDKEKLSL